MAEAIRPKYLLMKVNNKNRRTLESLDKESKSYYKIVSSLLFRTVVSNPIILKSSKLKK